MSFSQSPATRILAGHEIIAEDAVMSGETLRAVVMPARDKFVPDDRRGGPEVQEHDFSKESRSARWTSGTVARS